MALLARATLIIQGRYGFSSMSLDSKRESVAHKPAIDHYGREVRSLRLSVTQRCDLACSHCHREGHRPSSKEMSPREIEQMVRIAASMGVRKVRLTGVDMEALVGVSAALLNAWDMVKYLEKDSHGQYPRTEISGVRVIRKTKGEG